MDKFSKVKILCSFLKHNSNVVNALRCIQAETNYQVDIQDWIRETGSLEVILSFVQSEDVCIRRLAIYCLSSCVAYNYESQTSLSKLSLFNDLYTILDCELEDADQYVCLMLLRSVCNNNPCGQELASISGCVHMVLEIFGKAITETKSCSNIFQQLLVQCLKSLLSSPACELNQRAVVEHPIFCTHTLQHLEDCAMSDCHLIEYLCELTGAVFCDPETCLILPYRDLFICTLCSKLQSLSWAKPTSNNLVKVQRSIAALVKCLLSVIHPQGELAASAEEALAALCPRLVKVSTKLKLNLEIKQNLMYLVLTLLDRQGSNPEVVLKAGSVRRLCALTKSTDDPIIHCSVSYILLGLDELNAEELQMVRRITPACLVRMGLSLDKAKQLSNGEHIVTKTKKQLFESGDIMELISSDDDSDYSPEPQVRTPIIDIPKHLSSRKWKQLTPPSKPKNKMISSPGWKMRVKRLRSVLKLRNKQSKASQNENDTVEKSKKGMSGHLVHRPLHTVNR